MDLLEVQAVHASVLPHSIAFTSDVSQVKSDVPHIAHDIIEHIMQELRSNGWVLRKGVSSVSACKGVVEFFKEEARKPGGRHVITNGMRQISESLVL